MAEMCLNPRFTYLGMVLSEVFRGEPLSASGNHGKVLNQRVT